MSYIYRQCLCEKSSRLCWEIRGKFSTVFHSRHEEKHVLDFHLDRQIRNNQAALKWGVFLRGTDFPNPWGQRAKWDVSIWVEKNLKRLEFFSGPSRWID